MRHNHAVECPFCLPLVEPHIVIADEYCYAMWTREGPEGSAMVLPRAHRPTVFDLIEDEWLATRRLLEQMKAIIDPLHAPDGFNLGWNVLPVGGQSVPHAHCHLVPRYRDEPYAGRGLRAWIKEPSNRPPHHPPPVRPPWLTDPQPRRGA
jgi:diadenosine tetraphosphate (Ap4A) HIT family hydrolase